MSNNQIFSLGYSQKKKKLKFLILEQKLQTQMLNSSTEQQKQIDMYPLVSQCSHSFFNTTRRAK